MPYKNKLAMGAFWVGGGFFLGFALGVCSMTGEYQSPGFAWGPIKAMAPASVEIHFFGSRVYQKLGEPKIKEELSYHLLVFRTFFGGIGVSGGMMGFFFYRGLR